MATLHVENWVATDFQTIALENGFVFIHKSLIKNLGFPGGAVVENLPANAGDMGSSPGLGGSHMPQSN